jgi:SAM-dependent methyltransferase
MIRLATRPVALVDRLWMGCRSIVKGPASEAATPGAGVQGTKAIPVAECNGVAWPEFPTIAHSFWRAQELTLFRRYSGRIRLPAIDVGCGDGLFGRAAGFPAETTGLDYDELSLAVARANQFPLEVLQVDARRIPLPDSSQESVVSNSVFEHLPELDVCLKEMGRVLRPGGTLAFTLTLGQFTVHLKRLVGERDAAAWVKHFGHIQEPTLAELNGMLGDAGLSVEESLSYQPEWFSGLYRLMVSPAFQFFERRMRRPVHALLRPRLVPLVVKSLERTPAGQGACQFIVARKTGA